MNRDETMSGESIHRPRSLTFLLLSPLLFWLPDVYLADLEAVWVDETVNYRPWNKFFNKLTRDWKASEMPVRPIGMIALVSAESSNEYRNERSGCAGNYFVCSKFRFSHNSKHLHYEHSQFCINGSVLHVNDAQLHCIYCITYSDSSA